MERNLEGFAAACALWLALAAPVAQAQKSGGVLIMSHFDSPASMSMLEEATGAVNRPMMGVFNNLVIYDQHVPQNSMASIVPDLAIGWSWNEDGTELTMPLRQGVRWHDGKPFTAKDVQCTWDLLASGWSPVYPCHVSPRDMRAHPIGTGPFKFVEFRPNERIRVARNPEYWKPGRPYLDGIEWPIVPSLATRILGFVAGSFDQVFGVTIPPLQGLKRQVPQAVCDVFPPTCRALCSSTVPRPRSTIPSYSGRWRSAWIIKLNRHHNVGTG